MLVGGPVKLTRQFALRTMVNGIALLLSCGGLLAQAPPRQAPPSGGVQASAQKFRVLRSVSGTKGSEQGGQFNIEDPRTVFYIPEDKQIIVYFEWEGPKGLHRLEGLWKNPTGKANVISEFEYESREQRFGGYWSLVLSQGMATGMWTLEARVDGEVTGAHTFQVIGAARSPGDILTSRPLLPLSEIYKRLLAVSVFIEKLDAGGERISTASGFFADEGFLVTAFQAIDGATSLRVSLPDGRRLETREVSAWNRWQDWAIVKLEAGKVPTLLRAKNGVWAVGDRCFMLDAPEGGGHVILDGSVLGQIDYPSAGPRMSLSFLPTWKAFGSPVVNEYGELIGVVGGSVIPGQNSLGEFRYGYGSSFPGLGDFSRGVLAAPLHLIQMPAPERRTTSLAELAQSGHFVAPLSRNRFVAFGSLSKSLTKSGPYPLPVDERKEFSRKDSQMSVYINWEPKEKRKGITLCRTYNIENRLLGEGKPLKINLKPGERMISQWTLGLQNLQPGVYRVDVLLDNDTVWRAFFRMTD